MRSLLLTILFFSFIVSTQANDDQKPLNLDGIFTQEFKQEVLKVIGHKELTVFKTPIRGMQLYNNRAKLFGQVIVGNGKVIGRGLLSVEGSLTKTDHVELGHTSLFIPRGTFVVKSKNPSKPVLEANDVEVYYDFKQKVANVKSLSRLERMRFPNNQLSVGFNHMVWDFRSTDIDLDMKCMTGKTKPLYIRSQNIRHKGLNFEAAHFKYDFKNRVIALDGVEGIKISNATIVPANNKVRITENATIDTLREAVVKFDDGNTDHGLSKGDIIIESKEKYDGIAHYEFVTYKGEIRKLEFTNFHLTSRNVVVDGKEVQITENVGESSIPKEELIEIMPGVQYYGKVILSDYEKNFDLDGMVTLNLEAEHPHWIKYNTVINKKIQVSTTLKDAVTGTRLRSGLYLDLDYHTLEGAFIGKTNRETLPVFEASGNLGYDEEGKFYVLEHNSGGNTNKTERVTSLNYHHNSQKMHFAGRINLGENSQYFSQRSTGIGTFDKESKDLNMNVFMILDFKAPKKIFEEMIYELANQKHTLDARPTNKKTFQTQVSHMLTSGERTALGASNVESFKFAEVFGNSITLTDVNLKWSEEQSAFYSTGQIGLGNLYRMNADVKLNGFVYIPKHQNNIEMHLYYEANGEWFYMKRLGDQMYFRSSKDEFNSILKSKGRYQILPEKEAAKMIAIYKSGF